MIFILKFLVRMYQQLVSPFMASRCRFMPTCSSYTLEALNSHGFKGVWLGLRRLLRCHPWKKLGGSSGFDPVPPRKEKVVK